MEGVGHMVGCEACLCAGTRLREKNTGVLQSMKILQNNDDFKLWVSKKTEIGNDPSIIPFHPLLLA